MHKQCNAYPLTNWGALAPRARLWTYIHVARYKITSQHENKMPDQSYRTMDSALEDMTTRDLVTIQFAAPQGFSPE
jgi:hypothetical protein